MFGSCLNPQRVFNSSLGEYLSVPCGHCEYCRKIRERVWARRLELHAKSSGYVLFFTLTYSNQFLPKVYYDEKGIVTDFVYSSERVVFNRHSRTYSQTQQIIHSDEFNGTSVFEHTPTGIIRPPHFVYRRLNDKAHTPLFDRTNSFAISYPKDFQNFIKRCRINLSRYYSDGSFDPSFTYFGVSEYGPRTYRPHFHGLLFFRSCPPDVDALLRVLSKSWSKSPSTKVGKEFEPVRTKTQSAKYVSKYVCKDTTLPNVLLSPEFCTRTFKSISIPLGSQSFDIADIPSIFSKGTLLYDSLYYNKETCCFEPYKCSFPSCSWHRVFPKLFGRRLLSVSLLRSCFDRIFQYRHDPSGLPNLVKEFSKKYPFGYVVDLLNDNVVDEHISRYHGFSDPFDFPFLHQYHISKRSLPLSRCKTASYSYFLSRLLSVDLDFFLFGIPQNLTFCRKVLSCCNAYDFLSSPDRYLYHYLRYETIGFTDSLKYTHEQFAQFGTPFEFASIYTDFYDSLYPLITDYDEKQVSHFDLILSNFGLSLSSFYGADSYKIQFDYDFWRDVAAFHFSQEDKAFRVQSSDVSLKYDDL